MNEREREREREREKECTQLHNARAYRDVGAPNRKVLFVTLNSLTSTLQVVSMYGVYLSFGLSHIQSTVAHSTVSETTRSSSAFLLRRAGYQMMIFGDSGYVCVCVGSTQLLCSQCTPNSILPRRVY